MANQLDKRLKACAHTRNFRVQVSPHRSYPNEIGIRQRPLTDNNGLIAGNFSLAFSLS
jgi:hypothetical protein